MYIERLLWKVVLFIITCSVQGVLRSCFHQKNGKMLHNDNFLWTFPCQMTLRCQIFSWRINLLTYPILLWWSWECVLHVIIIGSMTYEPLFRVRSWYNGARCMSYFVFINTWLSSSAYAYLQSGSVLIQVNACGLLSTPITWTSTFLLFGLFRINKSKILIKTPIHGHKTLEPECVWWRRGDISLTDITAGDWSWKKWIYLL